MKEPIEKEVYRRWQGLPQDAKRKIWRDVKGRELIEALEIVGPKNVRKAAAMSGYYRLSAYREALLSLRLRTGL